MVGLERPHLKSGPPSVGCSSTSQRCLTGLRPEAGVAAVRSAAYPTGQKFFSLWKAGLMKLMRPRHRTAGQGAGLGSRT